MKKIIFILLKIAEIALLPIAYFALKYLGIAYSIMWCYLINGDTNIEHLESKCDFIFVLVSIVSTAFLFSLSIGLFWLVTYLIPLWISKNLEWSKNISEWLKQRTS